MPVWLPGYDVVQLGASGGPYDRHDNPKLCWHTTEGATLAGAETAFYAYPPHLGVDPATGERHQYVPLDRRSYSLGNSDAEDSYVVQVEVVGYAAQSHQWSDGRLEWLAQNVARPVGDAFGVPADALQFYGEGDGYVLASPSSPIRLTLEAWDAYSGHVGHQHCPGDDHWDPGRLNLARILALAYDNPEPQPEQDDDMANLTICAATDDGTQYVTDLATFKRPIANEADWNATVWCLVASGARVYYQDVNDPIRVPRETLAGLPEP